LTPAGSPCGWVIDGSSLRRERLIQLILNGLVNAVFDAINGVVNLVSDVFLHLLHFGGQAGVDFLLGGVQIVSDLLLSAVYLPIGVFLNLKD